MVDGRQYFFHSGDLVRVFYMSRVLVDVFMLEVVVVVVLVVVVVIVVVVVV